MFKQKFVAVCFIIASVFAANKDVKSKSTTSKTPELENRFFGLGNIFGQMFNNPAGGFGGPFQQQQYPQFTNWQNVQTPNQAQSNLDQYPQGAFNSQNNFGPGTNQNIQQFPNQGPNFNQQSNIPQYPSQGNFNPGNNFGQNQILNPGTLDGIPSQMDFQNNQPGSWNQSPGNQFGFQNQNGQNQGQNPNQMGFQNNRPGSLNQRPGNQFGFQNGQGSQIQNPNQMGFQNQGTESDDYNPVAILGKPVPVTTSVPDSIVFEDGCDTPAQRQCVQDCQSSTEYNPVCGSNNITYFNPGRFICARNCGLNIFIERDGRCF